MPSVIFRGKLIPQNVYTAYEGNDAALYNDLGKEVEAAMLCQIGRLKQQIAPDLRAKSLTEREIDDVVEETVIDTILNIQRFWKNELERRE